MEATLLSAGTPAPLFTMHAWPRRRPGPASCASAQGYGPVPARPLVVLAPASCRCRGAVGKRRGKAGGMRKMVYGTDVAESRGSAPQQLHLWQGGDYQTR